MSTEPNPAINTNPEAHSEAGTAPKDGREPAERQEPTGGAVPSPSQQGRQTPSPEDDLRDAPAGADRGNVQGGRDEDDGIPQS